MWVSIFFYPGLKLPEALTEVFAWSDVIDLDAAGYFGAELSGISIGGHEEILDGIEDGIYPQEFACFLALGDYGKCKILGVFLNEKMQEDSPVFIMDIIDRALYKVSNSVEKFFLRALECAKLGEVQDYFDPSEKVKKVIVSIDGDGVLPAIENSVSEYPFDSDGWRVFLESKDFD